MIAQLTIKERERESGDIGTRRPCLYRRLYRVVQNMSHWSIKSH